MILTFNINPLALAGGRLIFGSQLSTSNPQQKICLKKGNG